MLTKVRYFIHDVTNCKVCAKRVNPNGRGRRGRESNLESSRKSSISVSQKSSIFEDFRVDEIEGVGLHPLRCNV